LVGEVHDGGVLGVLGGEGGETRATKGAKAKRARSTRGMMKRERRLTDLSLGQGTVDTGGGLGGVSSEEGVLVDDENVVAMLEDSVCGTQTRETTSDDDNLGGHDVTRCMGRRREKRVRLKTKKKKKKKKKKEEERGIEKG